MVHRDIKPDNLLVQRLGAAGTADHAYTVKVGDFGLARVAEGGVMTATGVTMGTPAYMSPEQCQGVELDGRSDLYSLGIVLYEVATGYLPFETKSLSDAVYKHVYTEPPPPRRVRPDLSPALEEIILRCLAKQPATRYATATDLAAALETVTGSSGPGTVIATPPAPKPAPSPEPRPAQGEPVVFRPATPPVVATPPPGGTIMQPVSSSTPPPAAPGLIAGSAIPQVRIVDGGGRPLQSVALEGSGLTLGRQQDNDIVLDDAAISRHHLRIGWDGRRATVTDLGSSNGTLLGDSRLLPQVAQEWGAQDWVRAGPFWLRLELPAPARPPAPQHTAFFPVGAPAQAPGLPPAQVAPAVPAPPSDPGRLRVVLESDKLTLTPGQPTVVRVTLANLGSIVDHLRLSIEGVPAGWWRGPDQEVQLNPGAQAPVALNVHVPRAVDSYAGEYPVTVRARSRENPTESGTAQALWTVLPFAAGGLTVAPARASGRTEATYTLTLRNDGNAATRHTLFGEDEERKLKYRFAQNMIELDAGGSADLGLTVQAPRRLVGTAQGRKFTIQADEIGSGAPQTAAAEFVHKALIPVWVPPVAVMAVLGLCVLLSFLVNNLLLKKPEIGSFTPDPPNPAVGQQVTLSWEVRGARSVKINPNLENCRSLAADVVSCSFNPRESGELPVTLVAANRFGRSSESQKTINVREPDPNEPIIEKLDVNGQQVVQVAPGETVTITWNVINVERASLTLEPLGTVLGLSSSRQDQPFATTRYVLAANNNGKITKSSVQVIVMAPPPTPISPSGGNDGAAAATSAAQTEAANAAATQAAAGGAAAAQTATASARAMATAAAAQTGTASAFAAQTATALAAPTAVPPGGQVVGTPISLNLGAGKVSRAVAVSRGASGQDVVWVANQDSLSRIEAPGTGAPTVTAITLPPGVTVNPVGVAVGRDAVWIANQGGTLLRLRPDTGQVVGTPISLNLGAGKVSRAVTVSRVNNRDVVWVANQESLSRVEVPATGSPTVTAITLPTRVPANPTGAPLDPVGVSVSEGVVWIANQGGTLLRLNPASGQPVGALVPQIAGKVPVGVAIGAHVWAVNQDGTVSRIRPTP